MIRKSGIDSRRSSRYTKILNEIRCNIPLNTSERHRSAFYLSILIRKSINSRRKIPGTIYRLLFLLVEPKENCKSNVVLQLENVGDLVRGNVIDVLTPSKYLFRVTGRIRDR